MLQSSAESVASESFKMFPSAVAVVLQLDELLVINGCDKFQCTQKPMDLESGYPVSRRSCLAPALAPVATLEIACHFRGPMSSCLSNEV